MKVAIISDSHDNIPLIERAVGRFKELGIKFIVHAGDFVAPFSIRPLLDSGIEWRGVFGNNDGERAGLIKVSSGRIGEGPLFLELDGKKIVVVHKPEEISPDFYTSQDVVIYGHTHQKEIRKEGSCLVINPGELCGYLTGNATFAVLDTEAMETHFLSVL